MCFQAVTLSLTSQTLQSIQSSCFERLLSPFAREKAPANDKQYKGNMSMVNVLGVEGAPRGRVSTLRLELLGFLPSQVPPQAASGFLGCPPRAVRPGINVKFVPGRSTDNKT